MAHMTEPHVVEHAVQVPYEDLILNGDLAIPDNPRGIILFAHGSGSSRHSPRNRFVASHLHQAHFATLLLDLLTLEEEEIDELTARLRFDIPMLADRLGSAARWLAQDEHTRDLPLGLFGASTGAAAALITAAEYAERARAVVSRGGRPDLAYEFLSEVNAPTLLIVGGNDPSVIRLNQQALAQLQCEKHLEIVPHATHLFEEPGALEKVSELARDWFIAHL